MRGDEGDVLRWECCEGQDDETVAAFELTAVAVRDAFDNFWSCSTVYSLRADSFPVVTTETLRDISEDRLGVDSKELGGFSFYSRTQDFCITRSLWSRSFAHVDEASRRAVITDYTTKNAGHTCGNAISACFARLVIEAELAHGQRTALAEVERLEADRSLYVVSQC